MFLNVTPACGKIKINKKQTNIKKTQCYLQIKIDLKYKSKRKMYKRQHRCNFPYIIAALLNQDTQSHAIVEIITFDNLNHWPLIKLSCRASKGILFVKKHCLF